MARARDVILCSIPVVIVGMVWLSMSREEPSGVVSGGMGAVGASTPKGRPTPQPMVPPPRWATDPWGDFDPLPPPGPNDWLSFHPEAGQTFDQFLRVAFRLQDEERSLLFLQPLGGFTETDAPEPETLRRFAEAFFGVQTEVLQARDIDLEHMRWRNDPHLGNLQLLTVDLLDLLKNERPERALCVLGITMQDLYPGPDWNYAFGQAWLVDRVAVLSFARYRPAFWGESPDGSRLRVLRRSLKVLAHEASHTFGIRHCTAHRCLMNGSNHLEESDSQPLHLCPEDLRKLQWTVGFDVRERYRRLATLYGEISLAEEADWIQNRLKHLGTD